jgi:hypothetical protein
MRPYIDNKKARASLDEILASWKPVWERIDPEDSAIVSIFELNGPTLSILAHFARASIVARRSLALTQCERKEWPHNRCMNP